MAEDNLTRIKELLEIENKRKNLTLIEEVNALLTEIVIIANETLTDELFHPSHLSATYNYNGSDFKKLIQTNRGTVEKIFKETPLNQPFTEEFINLVAEYFDKISSMKEYAEQLYGQNLSKEPHNIKNYTPGGLSQEMDDFSTVSANVGTSIKYLEQKYK